MSFKTYFQKDMYDILNTEKTKALQLEKLREHIDLVSFEEQAALKRKEHRTERDIHQGDADCNGSGCLPGRAAEAGHKKSQTADQEK